MTTQEIASKLVDLCRKGDYKAVYQDLYSPDCVSIEPKGAKMEVCVGLDEIAAKGKAWNETMLEFHSSSIGDPVVAQDHFCMTMKLDATFKEIGRQLLNELCVYEVKGGKIVKEQFFYAM